MKSFLIFLNSKNELLFEQNFDQVDSSNHLENYITSYLDVMSISETLEQQISQENKNLFKLNDRTNNKKIYIYILFDGNKIVLVDQNTKSDEILKSMFQELSNLYKLAILNPFYVHDTVIISKKFTTGVNSVQSKYLR